MTVSGSATSNSLQPHGTVASRLLYPWDSPGKNTGVGCHALLLGIFLPQGSNPGLLHCRQILYHLSHQGSLMGHAYSTTRVAFIFQRQPSTTNDQTWVNKCPASPCLCGTFLSHTMQASSECLSEQPQVAHSDNLFIKTLFLGFLPSLSHFPL